MKVYIVISNFYEEFRIEGVYDKESRANEQIHRLSEINKDAPAFSFGVQVYEEEVQT